jgi:hypothetical protein
MSPSACSRSSRGAGGCLRSPAIPAPRPDALGALLVTGGAAALTLGLVKGRDWGWGSPTTGVVLALAVLALAGFALHCTRHRNPLVDPALFRSRAYSGATFVATLFTIAFGGMLLSIVLWEQDTWHWSALKTGLAIAPGPLMVPVFSLLVAGRAIARFGARAVSATGATLFGAGVAWWALAIGLHPDYAGDVLGGMLLTGVGVGLALPTYMASAAASLPPQAFATGSAVITMARQIGLAVGVAILIAVLGAPDRVPARLDGHRRCCARQRARWSRPTARPHQDHRSAARRRRPRASRRRRGGRVTDRLLRPQEDPLA